MEALQLKVDNLQWEVSRLDRENQKLREEHPGRGERADLETELERAQEDVASLTQQLKQAQARAAEAEEPAEDADQRAAETDSLREQVKNLQQTLEEVSGAKDKLAEELQMSVESSARKLEEKSQELLGTVQDLDKVKSSLAEFERTLEETRGSHEAQLEALKQDALLEHYKALESEREKWEAREARLVRQLDVTGRNHGTDSGLISELEAVRRANNELIVQLAEAKTKNSQLEGEVVKPKDPLSGGIVLPPLTSSTSVRTPGMPMLHSSLTPRSRPSIDPSDPVVTPTTSVTSPGPGVAPSSEETSATSLTSLAAACSKSRPTISFGGTSIPTAGFTFTHPMPSLTVTSGVISSSPFTIGTTHVHSSPRTATATAGHSLLASTFGPTLPVTASVPASVTDTAHPQPAALESRVPSYTALPTVMTHLPTIPGFSGKDSGDEEVFEEWLEQFEAVASLAGWSEHAKLVNLTTRLRGVAYSFFRSCTPEQRSSYPLLVGQLKKRFTPVQLTAIQTQLFHDRVQNNKESVDDYAQALRKLFKKSYSSLLRRRSESEPMAQMVLVNQFISGLRPSLKAKVVGTEGNLDQILVKARFEEAKARELALTRGNQVPKKPQENSTSKTPSRDVNPKPTTSKGDWKDRTCHNCGLKGHLMRACPYPRQTKGDQEAGGKRPQASLKRMATEPSQGGDEIEELRRKLHEAELAKAVTDAANVIRAVTSGTDQEGKVLGPAITSTVWPCYHLYCVCERAVYNCTS